MTQPDAGAPRRSDPSPSPTPSPAESLKVLLVEDNRFDAALVRTLLSEVEGENAPVLTCVPRLTDAEEVLGSSAEDCVLLDLGLPDAWGVEVVRAVVRKDPHVAVVVLTGVDDDETPLQVIQAGAQDFLSKRELTPELLWRTIRNAVERKEHELSLVHLATHDRLTGLANRELFAIHLTQAIRRLARGGERLAVMFLDLDSFKWVNDSLGHEAGDEVLRAFGERLRVAVRPQDVAARLGGDEFLVLCEQVGSEHVALEVARRIQGALETPFEARGRTVWLRVSVGVTMCGDSEASPTEVIHESDVAMYRAKEVGKGQTQLFDEQLNRSTVDRLHLVDDLHRALDAHEFRVHYQPVVDLVSGRAVGAEALARRQRPDGRLVMPDEFIGLAEESGLILPLGDWVLEEAASQLARWTPDGPVRSVSVNAAAAQITDPHFARRVQEILGRTGVDPGRLGIEVTETVLMRDEVASLETLGALKEMGLTLLMDDFGVGYSSLTYLQRYPFDVIKVDLSFVQQLGADPSSTSIVEGVIRLGEALGLGVVAEGVETQAQARMLREMGCPLAQGFHFAHAEPPDRLEQWWRRSLRSGVRPGTPGPGGDPRRARG